MYNLAFTTSRLISVDIDSTKLFNLFSLYKANILNCLTLPFFNSINLFIFSKYELVLL